MEDAALGIIPFLPIQNALGLILASIFQIRNVQNIMQKMYHPCVGWWKLTKITWNDKKRGYPPKMRSDFFFNNKKESMQHGSLCSKISTQDHHCKLLYTVFNIVTHPETL